MANIIGPKILDKLRSSDYKNSIYAIAEIIDNSIDAEAMNIDIITLKNKSGITDIYFVDNGNGMDMRMLEKCVVFAESNNSVGSKKTGFFGMGLPNSSLSQCKKFSASCNIGGEWWINTVDIDEMIRLDSLELHPVKKMDQNEISAILKLTKISNPVTIVHWTNIDRIDASTRPSTIMNRAERLLGRIHRYKIREGLKIRFLNYSDGNITPDIDHLFLENDPLFISTGETQVAKVIHNLAKKKTNPNPLLCPSTYFSKFIIDGKGNENKIKPLFFLPDDAQSTIDIHWKGKKYSINLTLAVAYKDVQKPGTRNGGANEFGKNWLGVKVKGNQSFPSGNISWVRNGREITCGNYSLFNVTQENQRFWSIELSYDTSLNNDNVLDVLLGLSNSKQSIKFEPDTEGPQNTSETASQNEKREELIAEITRKLNDAIRKATNILSSQAREWKREEDQITGTGSTGGAGLPGPTSATYQVLIEALGKGAQLAEPEIVELTDKIRNYLKTLSRDSIYLAVKKYSEIGIQNLIIYCEIDERDLFQVDKYRNINITLINIKHEFYKKIIEPLKDKNNLDLLASIELLISSLSRAGYNNFFDEKRDTVKKLFELTSSDLKELLNKQEAITSGGDDIEELED
jgi:hypothetical protein